MALRSIRRHIRKAELSNTESGIITGWLEFYDGYTLQVELTGNFNRPYKGKRLTIHPESSKPEAHYAIEATAFRDKYTCIGHADGNCLFGTAGDVDDRYIEMYLDVCGRTVLELPTTFHD